MPETPNAGLSDQATYFLVAYLLRRQEMQDLGARKYPTACDDLLKSLDATQPPAPSEVPTGDNVVALFGEAARQSEALDEMRALVLRVRRMWRADDQALYVPKPAPASDVPGDLASGNSV